MEKDEVRDVRGGILTGDMRQTWSVGRGSNLKVEVEVSDNNSVQRNRDQFFD